MLPTQQRLVTADLVRLEIEDRLVGERQLVGRDRRLEIRAQRELRDHGLLHLGLEVAEGVAVGGLRLVHRDIGVAQQLVDRRGWRGEPVEFHDGDPDAALDRDLAVQPQGSADDLEQLGHDLRDGRLVRDVLEQDRELVAAQAGSGVALPQRGTQARRDGLQHPVAGVVPERVVDGLEVVEVQEQHGETAIGVAPAAERVFDAITEQRPVREVGDRIVKGLIGELLLELLTLGDVAQVDHDPADGGVRQQVGEQTLGVQQATVAVADTKLEHLRRRRGACEQSAERRLHERSVLVGDGIHESAADEVCNVVSEDLPNRGARVLHGRISREQEDHVAGMLDQRAQADLARGTQHGLLQHAFTHRSRRLRPRPARSSAQPRARTSRSWRHR